MKPLILLVGRAGVGKDTVAKMLTEHGGLCIAQADPIKRFVHNSLGFSTRQLWGPSSERNVPDPRSIEQIEKQWHSGYRIKKAWLEDIGLPGEIGKLETWAKKHILGVEGLTPRHVLQTLGTEFGRNLDSNVWVRYAHRTADTLLEKNLGYTQFGGVSSKETERNIQFVVITDGRFRNEVLETKARGGMVVKIDGPKPTNLEGAAAQHSSETEQSTIPNTWLDYVLWNDISAGVVSLSYTVKKFVHLALPDPETIATVIHAGKTSVGK